MEALSAKNADALSDALVAAEKEKKKLEGDISKLEEEKMRMRQQVKDTDDLIEHQKKLHEETLAELSAKAAEERGSL